MLSLRSEEDAAVWEHSHVTPDFPQAFQNDQNSL